MDSSSRSLRFLSFLSGILVTGLAGGAFILSYDALRHFAAENGVAPGLVWIWPLVLDGSIIAFSVSAFRSSLYQESCAYAMTLVILATVASIVFNALHAPKGVTPKVMAGLPPLALFLSFELLVRQLKSQADRQLVTQSLGEMSSELLELEETKKKVSQEIRNSDKPNGPIITIRKGIKTPKKIQVQQRRKNAEKFSSLGKSISEIADLLNISERTVVRDLKTAEFGETTKSDS